MSVYPSAVAAEDQMRLPGDTIPVFKYLENTGTGRYGGPHDYKQLISDQPLLNIGMPW